MRRDSTIAEFALPRQAGYGTQRNGKMMKEKSVGIRRKIVGFHLDERKDGVAELECGHPQHVRHNPPWMNREWVTTAKGGAEYLGHELMCKACGAGQ
jgi:hypothetical protein